MLLTDLPLGAAKVEGSAAAAGEALSPCTLRHRPTKHLVHPPLSCDTSLQDADHTIFLAPHMTNYRHQSAMVFID